MFRTVSIAVSLLCLAPALASAGPITVSGFKGVNVGYYSPVTAGESRAVLGSVEMSGGTGIGPGIDGHSFEAYCVDILGPIFDPGTPQPPATFDAAAAMMSTWDMYPGATPQAGSRAAWLYNSYAAAIAAADANLERTALLMAIWNVLYDDDFTVDGGDFFVSTSDVAVRGSANLKLSALAANLGGAAAADATWLQLRECAAAQCADVQDFMGPAARTAPEPGTLGLLGLGLLAVRRVRRAMD
jgi:hypothetical protein